jgi:hypothetical protein
MKRTIKRTEIRIETLEITTIRRVPPDPEATGAVGNEMTVPTLLPSATAEPVDRKANQNRGEKKK